jgi:diaminopimelate decarboxylase/aspartate kinase
MGASERLFTPNFAPKEEYISGFESATYLTLDNLHPLRHWPEVFAGRDILVRMDPGHGRGHHKKVKTAGAQSKFGIPPEQVEELADLVKRHDINVIGLHSHVGSGITYAATWSETAMFLAGVADRLGSVRILNLGGGLGVPEKLGDKRLDLSEVKETIAAFRQARPEFELWMEPGRYLVAESGVLLGRVTQIKEKEGGRFFVGLDIGMNSLIRPALYGAYHPIVNLSKVDGSPKIVADVVGPICETGDVLGHKRRLPVSEEGDVFLIASAGAYGYVMGSQYNLRKPAIERILR